MAEPLNAARQCSSLIARISVASVFASLPPKTFRASNLSSFTGSPTLTFQGQQVWDVYRQDCIAIPLVTGMGTLSKSGA